MNTAPDTKILQVSNQIGELTRVEAFLEDLGGEWDLPVPLVFSLNLVLEEALTNIVSYGYDDQGKHEIEMQFVKTGGEITISIIDDGHEYDPTRQADPDVTLPVEERQIGGLGVFLIKKIMDKVEYQRINNKNKLILTKIIEP